MLAHPRPPRTQKRRGVVLVLILAMLGLLALIGVTFASFSGQAQIGARHYSESLSFPGSDQVMDFGLSQLINDTDNPQSVLRGHSLKRDMYGNDATNAGSLTALPSPSGAPLQVMAVTQVGTSNVYKIGTNIPVGPISTSSGTIFTELYGLNFYGWNLRLEFWQTDSKGNPVSQITNLSGVPYIPQTFEVWFDDTSTSTHILSLSASSTAPGLVQPSLFSSLPPNTALFFKLDNRFRHGFNGGGMAMLDHTNATYGYIAAGRYGNFRFNGRLLDVAGNPITPGLGDPTLLSHLLTTDARRSYAGMDESYDACDLENWFLAIQSADGQVVVPSFHRPGILAGYPANYYKNGNNDWNLDYTKATNALDSFGAVQAMSKILRPRAVDHPSAGQATFPDLLPDTTGSPNPTATNYNPNYGKVTYDVDNDGDGVNDAVWIDLGYPVQRDATGKMFKPMFAFTVTGLNGKMPLNTAGNLQDRINDGIIDASGNLVAGANYTYPNFNHTSHLGNSPSEINPRFAFQVPQAYTGIYAPPNASLDIIQLRRLLAGGFPWDPSLNSGQGGENTSFPPVAGRWGEEHLIAAMGTGAFPAVYNPATSFNPVRAGRSMGPTATPRVDGVNDDYRGLDFYPTFLPTPVTSPYTAFTQFPEQSDYLDSALRPVLPSERMRRFVTPTDISGSGRVVRWNTPALDFASTPGYRDPGTGADKRGRVSFFQYFRPPGLSPKVTFDPATQATTLSAAWIPDFTNNEYHGYESHRAPMYDSSNMTPQDDTDNVYGGMAFFMGAMPWNDPTGANAAVTIAPHPTPPWIASALVPPERAKELKVSTFDPNINALDPPGGTPSQGLYLGGSLAYNNADEMNLYAPSHYDAPYGPQDLEWLYRKQDVDGGSLESRLSKLDTGYFTAAADQLTRRRLFTTDTWDMRSYAWSPSPSTGRFARPNYDNTGAPIASANWDGLDPSPYNLVPEPSLAHGGRRINLNFPLPVDARPNEPVRQKWVADTYQMLKAVVIKDITLPYSAGDLAALSQFALNIIDFRDPDATMTRFVNSDVLMVPAKVGATPDLDAPPRLILSTNTTDADYAIAVPLVQYGMEYLPVAINEVLGYTFKRYSGGPVDTPRLFVELVNTLTRDYGDGTTPGTASDLDLDGWQLAIAPDDVTGRPLPASGQMTSYLDGAGVVQYPLVSGTRRTGTDARITSISASGTKLDPTTTPPTRVKGIDEQKRPDYLVLSNSIADTTAETYSAPLTVDDNLPDALLDDTTNMPPDQYYWVYLLRPANPLAPNDPATPKVVVDSFRFPYIQDNGVGDSTGNVTSRGTQAIYSLERAQPYRGGQDAPVLPITTAMATPPAVTEPAHRDNNLGFSEQTNPGTARTITGKYGANPITAASYTDAGGNTVQVAITHSLGQANSPSDDWDYFPFHDRDFTSVAELLLVPGCPPGLFTKFFVEEVPPNPASYNPPANPAPDDQTVTYPTNTTVAYPVTTEYTGTRVWYPYITPPMHRPKNTANPTPPPASSAPPYPNPTPNYSDYVGRALPGPRRDDSSTPPYALPAPPRIFPYLPDGFYYDSFPAADTTLTQAGVGWYKMFEFFDVPSPALGAIGPVAQGHNLDWYRQDLRPGQINLNLIIDEEVFFGLIDDPRLDLAPAIPGLPTPTFVQQNLLPGIVTMTDQYGTPAVTYPISDLTQYPAGRGYYASLAGYSIPYMKSAFSDFLKLRHGGTKYLFGHGSGALGAPYIDVNTGSTYQDASMVTQTGVAPDRPFQAPSYAAIESTIMRPAKLDYNLATPNTRNYRPLSMHTNADGTIWKLAPSIPPRGLFQIPDATERFYGSYPETSPNWPPLPPDAGWTGPPLLPPANASTDVFNPAGQGLRDQLVVDSGGTAHGYLSDAHGSLFDNTLYDKSTTALTPPSGLAESVPRNFLGGNDSELRLNPTGTLVKNNMGIDKRQHPYFRTEILQKVMNLSTVRTHQYAVWVTVGFFEVTKPGNAQLAFSNPLAAADQLGPELGVTTGRNIRYRSFFLIDRTRATGFNPSNPGDFRECVTYRRRIE